MRMRDKITEEVCRPDEDYLLGYTSRGSSVSTDLVVGLMIKGMRIGDAGDPK